MGQSVPYCQKNQVCIVQTTVRKKLCAGLANATICSNALNVSNQLFIYRTTKFIGAYIALLFLTELKVTNDSLSSKNRLLD